MAWVKLDDGFFNNQKIVSVSKDAKIIYLAGLCHAGSTLSDGYIPRNAVVILAAQCDVRSTNKVVNELVGAGLWIPVDGGFEIHDYLEHNTSSQEVYAQREAARERARRNRSQNVRANKSRSSQEVRKKFASQKEEIETEVENPSTDVLGEGASAPATPEAKPEKKPRAKRATQIPETWLPSDSTRSWAAGEGFTDDQVDGQILRFADHWRGKGETRKDWDATFRNWMRNAREWGHLGETSRADPAKASTGKITSVDQLFAEGDTDERSGYPEDSNDIEPRMAVEWPGQSADPGVENRVSESGFRAIAGGRR